jgi:hypothetical protein
MNHPVTENPVSGFPVSNIPDRRTWSAAVSPSNLAMAALVGFLCVGQATEWKILGRKGKANSSVKLGAPDLSRNAVHHSRQVRANSLRAANRETAKPDPTSEEVADRRPATRETQKNQGQLD